MRFCSCRDRSEERELDIEAETNVPLWDGMRPDYEWALVPFQTRGEGKGKVAGRSDDRELYLQAAHLAAVAVSRRRMLRAGSSPPSSCLGA